jgi:hypothetical protein
MALAPIIPAKLTIDNGLKRTNQFIKSSTDDFQDPVYLTFRVDFFPIRQEYPQYDGLYNSSLFAPISTVEEASNQNKKVEYSAVDWLDQYYGNHSFGSGVLGNQPHPKNALLKCMYELENIQDSPWYFQSIQGIGDLWKTAHRVKEGTKKVTLTFNCLESILQPLTDVAEYYRYAIYDQDRLSYRLPDNLRWFDMVIDLIEIRDIVDYSGDFYQKETNGQVNQGLKVLQFRCKMCEFDFSDFLGGSQSEHKVYTEDKPFSPSFKVNVGWVIQEMVSLQDGADFKQMNLFSGALDSLNNRLSRFMQNATRLPGALVGSVLNELQTKIDGFALGNVYSGVNQFEQQINNVTGAITGRRPAVGPNLGGSVGSDIYPPLPNERSIRANVPNNTSDLGDAY